MPIHPTFRRLPPKPEPSMRPVTASGKKWPPWTTTDVPRVTMIAIPRIVRPDDERCQRLDVVQVDTTQHRTVSFTKPSSVASARHPRLDAWIQDGRRVVHAVDEIMPPFASLRLPAALDHRVRMR